MINKQICTTFDSRLFHWKLFISVRCCWIKKIIANSYFQIKLMLKNKLRKRLGKKDRAETGQTQTCWLLRSQVKGPFLYILKQEVRIMLRLRHHNAGGRSQTTEAPEAPMVSRQYPDKASIAQYIYQHSKAPSRITWHLL